AAGGGGAAGGGSAAGSSGTSGAAAVSTRPDNEARDPIQGYAFSLEVTGAGNTAPAHGFFREFSGVQFEVNAIQYKTYNYLTGKPETVQIAGRSDPGTVSLKRGMTKSLRLFKWVSLVTAGALSDARATVTVTMRDRSYSPAIKIVLTGAWPSKFSMGSLNVETNEMQVEELTLVYETLSITEFSAG
ncbi:MAG: phage tail protein, partial [Caldilineaceae bacterium]